MFGFFRKKKIEAKMPRLRRVDLANIVNQFAESVRAMNPFEVPDNMYLELFNQIEEYIVHFEFKDDKRFVIYGRVGFLINELSYRLTDDYLSEASSEWATKWDNRMGAFWDLSDLVNGDHNITQGGIPEGLEYQDVLHANEEYYREGFICSQEKDIILDMIAEIKKFILNKKIQ